MARTRLIAGLITTHRKNLTIMKPVREAKARSRAMLCTIVVVYILKVRGSIHDRPVGCPCILVVFFSLSMRMKD
jgi:hypothetical protein